VITSLVQLAATLTHTKTCLNDFQAEFPEEWDWHVKVQFGVWQKFCKYWMDLGKNKDIPVHFFRYEDLSTKPREILKEVFEFAYGVESIEGTYLMKRIEDCVTDSTSGQLYKPRKGAIGDNAKLFTEA